MSLSINFTDCKSVYKLLVFFDPPKKKRLNQAHIIGLFKWMGMGERWGAVWGGVGWVRARSYFFCYNGIFLISPQVCNFSQTVKKSKGRELASLYVYLRMSLSPWIIISHWLLKLLSYDWKHHNNHNDTVFLVYRPYEYYSSIVVP